MSQVQSMALEMLMLVEQIEAARKQREDRRLALMDKDPDLVQRWFPEWFPPKQVALESAEAVEGLVEHAMEGGEVLWEADQNAPPPSVEEVEEMLRQFSTGTVALGDLGDGWE